MMTSSFKQVALVGLLLLVFVQLSFCQFEQPTPKGSKVVILTDDNFDEIAPLTRFMLIKFYAPWCGHCQRLNPEYEKAALALADIDELQLAKVDVSTQKILGQKFNIRSLPTLFFLHDGDFSMYTGGRTAADIEKWVRKNTQPIKVVTTEDEVNALRTQQKTSSLVLGTFESRESEDYLNYLKIMNDPVFGDLEFVERISTGFPAYTIFTPDQQELTIPSEEPSVTDWILLNAYPVVGGMDENDIRRYETRKLPLSVLFYDPANTEVNDAVLELFRKAATSLRLQASFGATNGVPGIQSFKNLGFTGSLPVVAMSGFNERGANFLPVFATTTVEEITNWVMDVIEGKVKPLPMSQPIPEKPSLPGEVAVVVGKSFQELVLDPTKDVLLEIYSPNCGHCKNLEPVYAQLAKHFENNDKIRIAKLDGTSNDIDYQIHGYPTILLYPANNKQPISYEKPSRTLEDLIEFVHSHSSSKAPETTDTKDEL